MFKPQTKQNGHPSSEESRVLVFSQRNLNSVMYQCFIYEFEDVVCAVDGVDLLAPPSTHATETRQLAHRMTNAVRKSVGMLPAGDIAPIAIHRDYDLLFAIFQFPYQAIYLNRLKGWRKRCRKAACYLAESWSTMLSTSREYYLLLSDVDYIFTHSEVSARALTSLLGRPCYFLPFAVDAERFCPRPPFPERSIDVLSVGRHSPHVHRALLQLSAERAMFYHFDTARNFQVRNFVEHRVMLAQLLKQARFFLAYKHNVDKTELTGGDESLAPRFFEAAAAGAVMLGVSPDCDEFRSCFDWDDAVIHLAYDGGDVEAILSALRGQPERLAAASRNGVAQCLARHDWAYRWATVLARAGLTEHTAMRARLSKLAALAKSRGDSSYQSPQRARTPLVPLARSGR